MTENNEIETQQLQLSDLNDELLTLIFLSGIIEPAQLVPAASTSSRFRQVTKICPFQLVLAPPNDHTDCQDSHRTIEAKLRGICSAYPGIAGLDVSDMSLENSDVAYVVSALPNLKTLHLSGCKKLTPSVVQRFKTASSLRALFMQRAFQMDSDALTALLQLASIPGSCLRSLAMSHLPLMGWQPAPLAAPSQWRHLALHNCSHVGVTAFNAIIVGCPSLRMLCLGGCDLLMDGGPGAEGLELGSNIPGAPRIRKKTEMALSGIRTGSQYGPYMDSWIEKTAVELAIAVQLLPELEVLEITFCFQGLQPLLTRLLASESLACRPVQIWDICTASSLQAARKWMDGIKDSAGEAAEAAALVRAAVRCSSPGRQTPLHAAAEDGRSSSIEFLLKLGAQPNVRDRRGASPLFAACEVGHAAAAAALLEHGADVTQRNTAGEAPLYIASLKGHEGVVDVLLKHCAAHGVSWQDPKLYGDGWTPLHAAAVGGRGSVVRRLLAAAGDAAPELVRSANRYGQTPVHVAARKGSPAMLQALVDAGGPKALMVADEQGRTAAEVARHNGNGPAWKILLGGAAAVRAEAARLRGTVPTLDKPRPQRSHVEPCTGTRWVGKRLSSRKAQQPPPS